MLLINYIVQKFKFQPNILLKFKITKIRSTTTVNLRERHKLFEIIKNGKENVLQLLLKICSYDNIVNFSQLIEFL